MDAGCAIAGQFAQFTLGTVRDEAGAQQTMPQEIGDPLGVFDVRLASWHGFDVLGIDDQHLNVAF